MKLWGMVSIQVITAVIISGIKVIKEWNMDYERKSRTAGSNVPQVPFEDVVCFRLVCDTKKILLLIELEGGWASSSEGLDQSKEGDSRLAPRPGRLFENWGCCAAWEVGLLSFKEERET